MRITVVVVLFEDLMVVVTVLELDAQPAGISSADLILRLNALCVRAHIVDVCFSLSAIVAKVVKYLDLALRIHGG